MIEYFIIIISKKYIMNIPKDIYEYLAVFADNSTILNMLSVNKQFSNPIFFERIFKKKYPLLIYFKKDNQSWKLFYLDMIYYLSKIEEFDIPYVFSIHYSPKQLYRKIYEAGLYNASLLNVTAGGDVDAVRLVLIKRVTDLNIHIALQIAAFNGYLDIVKLLIPFVKNRSFSLKEALTKATRGNNIDVIKYLKCL